MLKVIVKNGAPRSGKSIAAKHMTDIVNNAEGFLPVFLPAFHIEFKDELFKVAANTLGISVEDFKTDYDRQTPDKVWWCKDLASLSTSASMASVGEKKVYSQREWLIHMSENVIKPSFGASAFGDMFVNSMPEEGLVFCSDSGFPEELQPVIDHVGVENVLVVRIHRDGCTYEGDSRSMLTEEMFEENTCPTFIDVYNDGTEVEFTDKVEKLIGDWLNE